jgi:hypothetical protein
MSQENASSKPLIRYVNRQQMSWRAVDVERLIGEDHAARAIWTLVGRLDLEFRQKMASEVRAQDRRRSQVAEFCHTSIKSKLGLRQFHVRGLVKVQMEMLWAFLTYTCNNLQHWIHLRKLEAAAS